MDESGGNHTTGSKSEGERHLPYYINYRCYLKIDTNEGVSTEKGNHRFLKLLDNQLESCEDWIH